MICGCLRAQVTLLSCMTMDIKHYHHVRHFHSWHTFSKHVWDFCAACGLKENEGRRTSSRQRMKPLKWWEAGEAKNYERRFASAPQGLAACTVTSFGVHAAHCGVHCTAADA